MARCEHLIPFIFHWEDGVPKSWADRPLNVQFGRAKEKGLVILPFDKGGPTVCGVTYATYCAWKKKQGQPTPTVEAMVTMSWEEWLGLFKGLFWDRCRGDEIGSQAVADMLVDWCWTSGVPWPVRRLQKVLGVDVDGVVGSKTLYELNCWNGEDLAQVLAEERADYYKGVVKSNPKQGVFLQGWLNRVDDCLKWK